MFEDSRLNIFVAVAKEGSFTKAAASLGISQPAVSQNIAEIERATGMTLFERRKGEVVLTPQGEIFMKYAADILDSYAHAERTFAKIPSTTVRISASEEIYAYIVEPALDDFMKLHPEVVFERCLWDDADLRLQLAPSSRSPFEMRSDCMAKIRMSVSPAPKKMGDFSVTRESVSHFDLLFLPSQAFSCTRLCRLIEEFLVSAIS